ncbi:MAG: hypothetical protein CMH81_04855 [Nitrospiraceae bacterium]|nr:hypothetical protein [Nitrospiraceae bacterium]
MAYVKLITSNYLARFPLLVVFIVACGVVCLPSIVVALPPTLSDVTVEPTVLEQGIGVQVVTVSALVFDPDLNLKTVKVVVNRKGVTKKTVKLTDDGTGGDEVAEDGRFTAQLIVDTEVAERVFLKVKATDQERNQTKRGAILSIVNHTATPVLSELTVQPSVLDPQGGKQVVVVSVRVLDPQADKTIGFPIGDLKNVKLYQLAEPGARRRAGKLGRLLDDGTGGDVLAGDGVFTIRVSFTPLDTEPIPLQIFAKDFAGNKVAITFDLQVGTVKEPLVDASIADTNDDGLVDGLDVPILINRLGVRAGEVGYLDGLDLISDDVINMLDVDAVASNFGATGVAIVASGEFGTVFRGRVFDGVGNALSGVSVQLGTGLITGETNANGLFRMSVPVGATGVTRVTFDGARATDVFAGIRATDVTVDGGTSGQFLTIRDLPVFINGGVDNVFRDVSLPELDLDGAVNLSDPSNLIADVGEGVFQVKFGESLVVNNAGLKLRFSEGCLLMPPVMDSPLLSITRVNPAMLPIPLPPGQSSTLLGTFHPSGIDVNCPAGSVLSVVFDNIDRFNVADVPTLNGIKNGLLQPIGDSCTVIDVDTDGEANDLDDKVQCGPLPTPLKLGWYHTAITSSPCRRTTVVGLVRSQNIAVTPVAGVAVTLPGVGPVMTRADGSFTVLNVPAGPNGVLCATNPFTIRASVTSGDVTNSSQAVLAVPGGITNLGEIILGKDNFSITLLGNGLVMRDDSQVQFVSVNEISAAVATLGVPGNSLNAATVKFDFTVHPDQGTGTRSGALVIGLDVLGNPKVSTASFSPVTFAVSKESVLIDLSATRIAFVGRDEDGLEVVSTTPLTNNGVLTTGVAPGSLTFSPDALVAVLGEAGLPIVDPVLGGFAYTISIVGIPVRLSVWDGQTCPQSNSSCQDVTIVQGTAVGN